MIGPCAKAFVRCTIVAMDGARYIGENFCLAAQPACPREHGEGYEKCTTICRQVAHAEVVAAAIAGNRAQGGTAYLEGHTYACENCKAALAVVGVNQVVIGFPAATENDPEIAGASLVSGAAASIE